MSKLGGAISGAKKPEANETEKKKATKAMEREDTRSLYCSAIRFSLMTNLNILSNMCEDKVPKGMQSRLIEEALEDLTEKYLSGNGRFTFNLPELLKEVKKQD